MKLRNKKTGEMGIINHFDNQCIVIYPIDENWNAKGDKKYVYHSLTDLNKEWEDMPEEPKDYYVINLWGEVSVEGGKYQRPGLSELGLTFGTEEEAEKAAEKLKAWKRLRDYWDTDILGWEIRDMPTGRNWQTVNVKLNVKARKEPMELLDICFGGEE